MNKAKALYTDFTGHEASKRRRVFVPSMPTELVEVGKMMGIAYRTTRNGQTLDYFHEFKVKNAPILAVSPCGKMIFVIGGRFKFGSLGFVD